MTKGSEVFIGIDTAKAHNAVAVAEAGRDGEGRYLGTLDNTPDAVAKLVRKLADRYEMLHFCFENREFAGWSASRRRHFHPSWCPRAGRGDCYEAGPTGYGLYRQILA